MGRLNSLDLMRQEGLVAFPIDCSEIQISKFKRQGISQKADMEELKADIPIPKTLADNILPQKQTFRKHTQLVSTCNRFYPQQMEKYGLAFETKAPTFGFFL